MQLIEPKSLTIGTKNYVLSKFPAVQGREIVAKYPLTAMPKLGDYKVNEETMLKLMSFVGVEIEGRAEPLRLSTVDLVNNHCGGWETLARVEWAMLEYNVSFFANGRASIFFAELARKVQPLISKTLTDLLAQSSLTGKPPSAN